MGIDVSQAIAIAANIGVIAGIVFLGLELRQNNKLLAAQARYSLRQYRSDIADTFMAPHIMQALQKYAAKEDLNPSEKGTVLMLCVKVLELWEWQYGEHKAGMLALDKLPVDAWRVWYHDRGEVPCPIADIWQQRRHVLSPQFVEFFENNVINKP